MNKSDFLNLVKAEKGQYVLAAIIFICDNGGNFKHSYNNYNSILDHLKIFFDQKTTKKPKTPVNTLKTCMFHQSSGKLFFKLDKTTNCVSLTCNDIDCHSLEEIKSIAKDILINKIKRISKSKSKSKTVLTSEPNKHLVELEKYPEINSFVKILEDKVMNSHTRNIAVHAPVKSGKKIIKLQLAVRGNATKKYKFCVVSSLHSKDCKSQREEYKDWGVPFLNVFRKQDILKNITEINNWIEQGYKVVILHDESDYGTDFKQLMSKLYTKFTDIKFVGFSASNAELELSSCKPEILIYKPSSNYCGANWYILKSLFCESEPFLNKNNDLSEQGFDLCEEWLESDKDFLVVRFSGGIPKDFNNKDSLDKINNNFKSKKINKLIVVNKDNTWDWGECGDWKRYSGNKTLVLLCQTATRSVEWNKDFLRSLFAYHDYRSKDSTYSAKLQAMLRVAHFKETDSDHDIKPFIYGCFETIRTASFLEYNEDIDARRSLFEAYEGKISARVSNKNNNKYDYSLLIFDSKPSENDLKKKCMEYGIRSVGNYNRKFRYITRSNVDDMSNAIIRGAARSTNTQGGIVVVSIDGCNEKYKESFERLLLAGYKRGQYVAFIPIGVNNKIETKSNSMYESKAG